MDQVMQLVDPAKQFAKDSIRLVKRCTKPDRKGKKLIFLYMIFLKLLPLKADLIYNFIKV
jgi:hypothetical protein